MKCMKCGAELKEGCIYCSVCGNEAQISPDYSMLEDDYLRSLLREENQENRKQPTKRQHPETAPEKKLGQTPPEKSRKSGKKQMSSKIPIIVVCCILLAAIIAGILIKLTINRKNANSYDYQVEMARQEAVDKNYKEALHYYRRALSLKSEDTAVRLAMADIYMEQKDYDSAKVLLMEAIETDHTNETAYRNLIRIYEEAKDYESIVELASGVTETAILELFQDYIVAPPVLSPNEGEYEEYLEVTLFSVEEFDIYYTLDETVPDAKNGILYDPDKGIPLEESGEYTVSAVCVNDRGISSEVATATYVINIVPPEYATVTPDGGRIGNETRVTIEAAEDCSIYYTWDETDPTENSAKYEEPIEIPTGNNILSVLVVNDKTGLDSGVYRTNFIYYP
ncbi:MAG: FN3 associated domain-containing protein [Roseburia sp.]